MERNCGLLFLGQTLQRQWTDLSPVASVWVEPLKNWPVGRDRSVYVCAESALSCLCFRIVASCWVAAWENLHFENGQALRIQTVASFFLSREWFCRHAA